MYTLLLESKMPFRVILGCAIQERDDHAMLYVQLTTQIMTFQSQECVGGTIATQGCSALWQRSTLCDWFEKYSDGGKSLALLTQLCLPCCTSQHKAGVARHA